jgi:hypothetical protein
VVPALSLHADLPLPWLDGEGPLSGDPIAVPEPAVRLDHTYRAEWTPPLFRTTSNGLASGNTIAEATAHALAELCERDALARLRARPRTDWYRLDLGSVDDPDCRCLLGQYAARPASGGSADVRVPVRRARPWPHVGVRVGSTMGVTGKPMRPCTASCSPGCGTTRAPRRTTNAAPRRARPGVRSSGASSDMPPARSSIWSDRCPAPPRYRGIPDSATCPAQTNGPSLSARSKVADTNSAL